MNGLRAWLVIGVVLAATALSAHAAATGGVRLRHHPAGCTTCAQRRALAEATAPAPEMKAMRIELIKQQILRKLRLKEPPAAVAPRSALPKPLAVTSAFAASGELARRQRQRNHESDDEDGFFAKTDHVILFPYQGEKVSCPDLRENELHTENLDVAMACFPFLLPNEIQAEDLTSADLWLYRKTERRLDVEEADAAVRTSNASDNVNVNVNNVNMTLAVAELLNWDLNKSFQRFERLGSSPVTHRGGWVRVNLLNAVKDWLQFDKYSHVLTMTCQGCDPNLPFLGSDGPFKPFLAIKTHAPSRSRRPRRNVHCTPGMQECCRDSLYINFREIGWGDWIIEPSGYHANFCRGSCRSVESLPTDGSPYSSVLRKAIMQHKNRTDLVQCCTPTELSPLALIYMKDNQTVTQTTLPKMIVDACGCM